MTRFFNFLFGRKIGVKLEEGAKKPTRNHKAAGWDLFVMEGHELKPGERKLFKTGVSFEIPSGYWGQICDRSGLAYKNGLHVIAGVIDEDYKGDVGVVLVNLGKETVNIEKGTRAAQIVFQRYCNFPMEIIDSLGESDRQNSGFGSSGLK